MILASASPRRVELMARAGYDCRVVPADIDESHGPDEPAIGLVARLARAKALAVLDRALPNEIVVAADTVVALDDRALGKPRTKREAASMLSSLSGREHHVSTGCALALVDGEGRTACDTFVDTTAVTFYRLSEAEIDAYVASGEPMDKAGAYGIQGLGGMFVKGINGNYDTVVGLPVAELSRRMRSFVRSLAVSRN